jgi:hypothetical protein
MREPVQIVELLAHEGAMRVPIAVRQLVDAGVESSLRLEGDAEDDKPEAAPDALLAAGRRRHRA